MYARSSSFKFIFLRVDSELKFVADVAIDCFLAFDNGIDFFFKKKQFDLVQGLDETWFN